MNGLLLPILTTGAVSFAFSQSTLSGKVIVLILFASSIGAWTVMITKFIQLSLARRSSERFLNDFRIERQPSGLFVKQTRFPQSPLHALYEAGCKAMSNEFSLIGINPDDLFRGALDTGEYRRLEAHQIEAIRIVVDRTMADEALKLEDRMGVLATAVSACPFLGLLGTVWGVMDAFGGMATSGAAMLSAVAPGISGALLTTVVGLIVALPSSIGYNMLTSRIRRLAVQMDNFSQEFVASVQQHYSIFGD
ncbi:MAG: biopolymer transport protein TolQ [Verrucomicrobiota bacterium]|jgi:biopolymer transport protein TolQ|nr:biopolymer transport protein TolQ [Verrucomicrobiota bacterium]MDK2963458.1 biopolymer transport protein TolQ [Verrucomicrobiota bacterium]